MANWTLLVMPYISDESNSDSSDNEVEETVHLSGTDDTTHSDTPETPETPEKQKKKVLSSVEVLEEYSNNYNAFKALSNEFSEKEKAFEKERKEFYTEKRRLEREQESLLKRLSKSVLSDSMKSGKKKRTGNKTGGFNKVAPVPKPLRKYLDLDESERSRSEVNKLLHAKFKAEGFKNGKTTTISSKKAAKALGVSKDFVIEFSEFSKFLAKFYNAEKLVNTTDI